MKKVCPSESMIKLWYSSNKGNFIEIVEPLNTLMTQIYFYKGFWGKDSKSVVSYQKLYNNLLK